MQNYEATYHVILGTESGSFGPMEEKRRFKAPSEEDARKTAESFRISVNGRTTRSGSRFSVENWTLVSVK